MYQDELDYRKLAVIEKIKVWQPKNMLTYKSPQI